MGFRLVRKSVTLDDLERRNDRYITSKWLKIDLYRLRRKCTPKNLVFSDISFMAIFAQVTENQRIIHRHLRNTHPLLDYDASESQSMLSI